MFFLALLAFMASGQLEVHRKLSSNFFHFLIFLMFRYCVRVRFIIFVVSKENRACYFVIYGSKYSFAALATLRNDSPVNLKLFLK